MKFKKQINWKEGKVLYLLLWTGALFFTAIMIGIRISPDPSTENLFSNTSINNTASSGEAINELLLSAGQLNIAEKKSFISLYLKPVEVSVEKADKESTNANVYQQILQRKINRLQNRKKSEDFSIRPTPK